MGKEKKVKSIFQMENYNSKENMKIGKDGQEKDLI